MGIYISPYKYSWRLSAVSYQLSAVSK